MSARRLGDERQTGTEDARRPPLLNTYAPTHTLTHSCKPDARQSSPLRATSCLADAPASSPVGIGFVDSRWGRW